MPQKDIEREGNMGSDMPVRHSCDTRVQTIRVDKDLVGHGSTRQDALDDFFDKVLAKAEAELNCNGACTDPQSCCSAEIVETAELERLLRCNRVGSKGCPKGARWKCFWADQPGLSTDVKVRCTCVPIFA